MVVLYLDQTAILKLALEKLLVDDMNRINSVALPNVNIFEKIKNSSKANTIRYCCTVHGENRYAYRIVINVQLYFNSAQLYDNDFFTLWWIKHCVDTSKLKNLYVFVGNVT